MNFDALLATGTILANRYEICNPLGEGGTGIVYLAKDNKLNDFRAIKQMAAEYISIEEYTKAISDFRREAELLSKIKHPSIPRFYDYFVADGYYYLVMQYITGITLLDLLEQIQKPISEKRATKWGIKLCEVLSYIHNYEPPIIYRDMKPANIMYNQELNQLYIIDFGTARFVAALQMVDVTAVGTLGYAPPELFHGIVRPETDIYSLGATLIHLLVGKCPAFTPNYGFNFSQNPRPNQLNPNISCEMDEILVKAVSMRPGDRYSSAQELKQALINHLTTLLS
jgi:eukaryotic-like serine/threonine-protein kinase